MLNFDCCTLELSTDVADAAEGSLFTIPLTMEVIEDNASVAVFKAVVVSFRISSVLLRTGIGCSFVCI